MPQRLLVVLIVCLAAVGVPSRAAATPINLVTDGGFENPTISTQTYYNSGPLGAWTLNIVSDSAGLYLAGNFPDANVTEGRQALDLAMGGFSPNNSISQTIATTAGQQYTLTFDWGSEYNWGTYSRVAVGNLTADLIDNTFTPNTGVTGTWIQYSASYTFTALSNSDVLTFTDLSAANTPGPFSHFAGLTLDNVWITAADPLDTAAVPEPATLTLLGLGLAGIAARRRRRQ